MGDWQEGQESYGKSEMPRGGAVVSQVSAVGPRKLRATLPACSSHPGSMLWPQWSLWTMKNNLISLSRNIFQLLPKSLSLLWNLSLSYKVLHILIQIYLSGLLLKCLKDITFSYLQVSYMLFHLLWYLFHLLSARLITGGPTEQSPRMTSVRKWCPEGPFLYSYGISWLSLGKTSPH